MFGMNRVRVAIMLALAARGGSATTNELIEELQTRQNTISRHLRDMEETGAVVASVPRDQRVGGVPVSWSLDRVKVRAQLDWLRVRML
ncbi:helix-turn-helix domain-containing protein [Enemella sp. A6]|uniref:helix-turn-helix domain-containing protein n=1 Tax=Enemella sp. A6 TaxID=3440152 RepID=UPI003EB6A2B2